MKVNKTLSQKLNTKKRFVLHKCFIATAALEDVGHLYNHKDPGWQLGLRAPAVPATEKLRQEDELNSEIQDWPRHHGNSPSEWRGGGRHKTK